MEEPLFFSSAGEFNDWLLANHEKSNEQWIGFYKVKSGRPSMTWSESVDQALCYGWIDGLRKSIDEVSYKIRFTPRKPKSHWSAINLAKMKMLLAENLVSPAGIAIYEKRDKKNVNGASFEQKNIKLKKEYEESIKRNAVAWAFFNNLPPSAKKPSIWWVMSAKQETTRQRRLGILISSSERGERIPMLIAGKKK
ncbi:MAG: YdeI/OmpD-associated family protein [Reichenbachiella sp.]|uniref:YdeI/OmpD-associated family protein n=1 Tax=Reichenbachiella sp. TaxID=2184521 RepID=UPI003263CA93